MAEQLVFDRYLNGPPDSANGGIACGDLALYLGGEVEVTLRAPPPLEQPLALVREGDASVELRDASDQLIARAVRVPLALDVPEPVSWDDARAASQRFAGHAEHAFPTCFSCGPARRPDEALCIHPGPLGETQAPVAGTWRPHETFADPLQPSHCHMRYVAAAIDCAGAWATMPAGGALVLGRMRVSLQSAPRIGEPCVVLGWALGIEGRKHSAGTAAFSEDGRILGCSRQTWIRIQ